MRQLFLLLAIWLTSTDALCCRLADTLVSKYGISFSGFEVEIPWADEQPNTRMMAWLR